MKIYLAGPMRGYDNYNFPAFNRQASKLRSMGFEVFNPAEHEDGAAAKWEQEGQEGEEFPIRHYMKKDLPQLLDCDAVCVLPGWEASQGARVEVDVARGMGMNVYCSGMTLLPENVLSEAFKLTSSDRNKTYGHPRDNFGAISLAISSYLRAAGKLVDGTEITMRDVGNMMVLMKVMRDAHAPKRDNLVDIAGYVRCIERTEEL